MNAIKGLTWTGLALAATYAWGADAQSERAIERLEITMTLLPEQAENAAQVIQRIIDLPPPRADQANDNSDQADDNSQAPDELPGLEHGQGQGLETAVEAREAGREFGQDVAADARENRENAGRGDDPPGPPETPPGPPDDLPTPPANPGRP
jgi:hypothetical protein